MNDIERLARAFSAQYDVCLDQVLRIDRAAVAEGEGAIFDFVVKGSPDAVSAVNSSGLVKDERTYLITRTRPVSCERALSPSAS